jgi:hypothetical protein
MNIRTVMSDGIEITQSSILDYNRDEHQDSNAMYEWITFLTWPTP